MNSILFIVSLDKKAWFVYIAYQKFIINQAVNEKGVLDLFVDIKKII